MNNLQEIALTLIPGIGNVLVKQLLSYCGSAELVFKTTKGKLLKIPGIGEKLATAIVEQDVMKEAENQLQWLEKTQSQALFYTDKNYPQRLKVLHDSPALLYVQGNVNLNHEKTIGIVGTRNASEYGKSVTEKIIADLVLHNPLIVSGLAYGIDITAHKAALHHQLPTLGVMASGLQTIYPPTHQKVAEQMKANGGVATEYSFGVKPDAPRFPERNRIIAGISDVLLVIETGLKGGTLITVDVAAEYKKPILAVPGNLGVRTYEGCNDLIRSHKALIYTNVADLENIAGWTRKVANTSQQAIPAIDLSANEQKVYDLLCQHKELHLDQLAWQSQIPLNQLANLLLNLEFQGLVKSKKGKMFGV